MTLHHGDMREVLATLAPESIDAIVTDPPYEISFMSAKWDGSGIAFDPATWAECLRVLKPGGHLLAMGGTRTYHRLVCAIEDAGFEIRDTICWLYGSGFPKSLDVSKAIDKAKRRDYVAAAVDLGLNIPGNNLHDWTKSEHAPGDAWWERFKELLSTEQWQAIEREVVGVRTSGIGTGKGSVSVIQDRGNLDITAPATPEAEQWHGWGTALKPAWENITVARKPLAKGNTVARNVLEYGTGAINVDACRIGRDTVGWEGARGGSADPTQSQGRNYRLNEGAPRPVVGRWPANVVLDEEAARSLDEQSGERKAGVAVRKNGISDRGMFSLGNRGPEPDVGYNDRGGASRFFKVVAQDADSEPVSRFLYTSKASRSERGEGNTHNTVKPISLMRWLVRMVTPPGGTVLDPFTGSGTTGIAAFLEGFAFVGVEQSEEYLEIARGRIEHTQRCGRQAAFEMGEPA